MPEHAQVSKANQFVDGMATNAAERFLQSGLNVNALRTNNVLRKEEWVQFDTAVIDVFRQRLVIVQDLISRGLTHNLGGLGTLVSQYEAQSDMTGANVDMAGTTRGEEDDITFDLRSVPVPITHKDFSINIRRLLASRKLGESVDTTQASVAARRVADANESMVIRGSSLKLDGNAIYGLTNHPDRNTIAATGAWATIANPYADTLRMIKAANADNVYGPFVMYVSKDIWPDLLNIYSDGSGETVRDRILRIPEIQDIKACDELDSGDVVMVAMQRDVIDLGIAQDITTIEWQSLGGMMFHFKVMNALVPRVKSDHAGRSGIVHLSGAV